MGARMRRRSAMITAGHSSDDDSDDFNDMLQATLETPASKPKVLKPRKKSKKSKKSKKNRQTRKENKTVEMMRAAVAQQVRTRKRLTSVLQKLCGKNEAKIMHPKQFKRMLTAIVAKKGKGDRPEAKDVAAAWRQLKHVEETRGHRSGAAVNESVSWGVVCDW